MKSDLPKALTLVGGKTILEHLLASIRVSDVDPRPIVVVGDRGGEVRRAMGDVCDYVEQGEPMGTGHAVASAREAAGRAEVVVVLYGDHPFVSAQTLRRLVSRHEERRNTLTLMTTTVPDFQGWCRAFEHWGRVVRGSDGRIVGIREYKDASPAEKEIREVNPALMCFDAAWLWENIRRLGRENAQREYYLTDLVAMAVAQERKLSSISVDPEEAVGINTPEEREIAETILARRRGARG